MANENDELEKAFAVRLATLATAVWPFNDLPDKLNVNANQSFQEYALLPFGNVNLAIGDGATTKMAGICQIDFFQAYNEPAAQLTQRVDTVSDAFFVNRRSVDLPAGVFIIRFPRKPTMRGGPDSATHRTRTLEIEYSMRAFQ